MIVIAFGLPENELPWFCSCHRFESAKLAYDAFTRIGNHDPGGKLNIGVYRHHRVGLDPEPGVLVSVVGLKREGVETAEELMGGEEIELHPSSWADLIARRAQVVLGLAANAAASGQYRIVHEGEGMKL